MDPICKADLRSEHGQLYARLTFNLEGDALIVDRVVIRRASSGHRRVRVFMPSVKVSGIRVACVILPNHLYAAALGAIIEAMGESGDL